MPNPKGREPSATVEDAIRSRRSMRAFLPDPVAPELIQRILETAARSPSGSNTQPWKVYVATGAARDALCEQAHAEVMSGGRQDAEYQYYMKDWREPYLARRRNNGWSLYGLLGIEKGDKARMAEQMGRNYLLFDAPVGMIFTIDRDMEMSGWFDSGMFMQSIMVAAREFGLDTCPQQAWAYVHGTVRKVMGVPDGEIVVCGMALGYADMSDKVNELVTPREEVEAFTTFVDTPKG